MKITNWRKEFGQPIKGGFISGIPFTKPPSNASEENKAAYKKWLRAVKEQTGKHEGLVKGPCRLAVTFYLPEDKFKDRLTTATYGPDLDNLAKPFLDAIKKTAFNAVGCDGDACIISLELSKVKVKLDKDVGAGFQIFSKTQKTKKKGTQ